MDSERELILEDARSILDGLWRMARLARQAAESLDARTEEDLNGMAEAVEIREALERVQGLSVGSEQHAPSVTAPYTNRYTNLGVIGRNTAICCEHFSLYVSDFSA